MLGEKRGRVPILSLFQRFLTFDISRGKKHFFSKNAKMFWKNTGEPWSMTILSSKILFQSHQWQLWDRAQISGGYSAEANFTNNLEIPREPPTGLQLAGRDAPPQARDSAQSSVHPHVCHCCDLSCHWLHPCHHHTNNMWNWKCCIFVDLSKMWV